MGRFVSTPPSQRVQIRTFWEWVRSNSRGLSASPPFRSIFNTVDVKLGLEKFDSCSSRFETGWLDVVGGL